MTRTQAFCLQILVCMSSLAYSADPSTNNDNASPKESSITSTTIIETGYLEAKPGYTGKVLGAEIVKITFDEPLNLQIIEINVPIYLDDYECHHS